MAKSVKKPVNHPRSGQHGTISHSEASGCHYSIDDHPNQTEWGKCKNTDCLRKLAMHLPAKLLGHNEKSNTLEGPCSELTQISLLPVSPMIGRFFLPLEKKEPISCL